MYKSVIQHPEEPKNAHWLLEEGLLSILSFTSLSQYIKLAGLRKTRQ